MCDISGFQDPVNIKQVGDNTKIDLISYWVANFQNLHNMALMIKS